MSPARLMASYSYGFPDDERTYRTRLPMRLRYGDGTQVSIEVYDRSFYQTISIPSRKRVYTLVVWIQKKLGDRAFATNATVFVK